jgi:hypothetical protein
LGELPDDTTEPAETTASTDVPFIHNYLHELESLWWVAVWVVFHNYFSKETLPRDPSTATLQDANKQLIAAEVLFPTTPRETSRRDAFQDNVTFKKTCLDLPDNKETICKRLNALRLFLLKKYKEIEARPPPFVDSDPSNDIVYDKFTHVFLLLATEYEGFELESISGIKEKLSNLNKRGQKRPRSETNDTSVARK